MENKNMDSNSIDNRKPPLGLCPRFLRKEQRVQEICAAIIRFHTAGKKVPEEWLEELVELVT